MACEFSPFLPSSFLPFSFYLCPYLHPSLSMRWSPTRSALAMMVSDGLTAVLDTKKLPSTTYRLSKSCALQFTSSADVLGSCPNLVGQGQWVRVRSCNTHGSGSGLAIQHRRSKRRERKWKGERLRSVHMSKWSRGDRLRTHPSKSVNV